MHRPVSGCGDAITDDTQASLHEIMQRAPQAELPQVRARSRGANMPRAHTLRRYRGGWLSGRCGCRCRQDA